MSQARELVEAGFPREVLQRAMTADAAAMLGLSTELGSLKPGSGANVCLWTSDPFDEKAKVRFSFVDGHLKQWDVKPDKASLQMCCRSACNKQIAAGRIKQHTIMLRGTVVHRSSSIQL